MARLRHERPNILWLMTDEQRCDSMGCYGSSWAHTPNLDRLAGEGAVFRNALTASPVCVPARLSILTGRLPHDTGVWANTSTPCVEQDHLTAHLTRAGYRTATFGKQHYLASNPAFQSEAQIVTGDHVSCYRYAKDYDESRFGVVKYPPKPFPWIFGGRFPEAPEETPEASIVREAMAWLENRPADEPFLLRVSFNGPHTPVAPPEPFDTLIPAHEIALAPEAEEMPEDAPKWIREWLAGYQSSARLTRDEIQAMRRYYYGQVAFLDQQFGALIDWMRERGLLERTIVVYVSDHGTHLGDFGLVQKQTFYEPIVRVPLLFWFPPAVAARGMLDTPVSACSLLPTVLELAGVEVPPDRRQLSLAEALRHGREPATRPIISALSLQTFPAILRETCAEGDQRVVLVREGDWKLSLCFDPEPCDGTLHNLRDDLYERENLYHSPDAAGTRERLVRVARRQVADASDGQASLAQAPSA